MKNIHKNFYKYIIGIILVVFLLIAGEIFISNGQYHTSTPINNSKIKHIVIIMQENRSFDSYFGTFPGANGIPMQNGVPSVCINDPNTSQCVKPYHDVNDVNGGGPHGAVNAAADINSGKMDGFISQAENGTRKCANLNNPNCTNANTPDVMGYHTGAEIPNYWSYAKNFVLQDNMFEPNSSWSLPEHLFLVSEWSAKCSSAGDPLSCINELQNPDNPPDFGIAARRQAKQGQPSSQRPTPDYAWTDLTYILNKNNVSWAYYVMTGTEPDCQDDTQATCVQHKQNAKTPGIWNPLPYFETVKQDNQLNNIQSLDNFFTAVKNGNQPAVSWITPSGDVSEHPPGKVSAGQAYVTTIINAVMKSSVWDSTAIFLTWDDWGGIL